MRGGRGDSVRLGRGLPLTTTETRWWHSFFISTSPLSDILSITDSHVKRYSNDTFSPSCNSTPSCNFDHDFAECFLGVWLRVVKRTHTHVPSTMSKKRLSLDTEGEAFESSKLTLRHILNSLTEAQDVAVDGEHDNRSAQGSLRTTEYLELVL
jgi:hypothetical protein